MANGPWVKQESRLGPLKSATRRLSLFAQNMSPFKAFLKRVSHFIVGSVVSRLFGFITLPILTRVLTTEQYGILSLATTTTILSVAVAKAGLPNGILRYYKQYSDSSEKLTEFSSTVFLRGLILSFITFGLYLTVTLCLGLYLKIEKGIIVCFTIIAFSILIGPLNSIISNLLVVTGRTVFLNVIAVLSRIGSFCLSMVLFLYILKGLYGFLIGGVLCEVTILCILFYWFFGHYRVDFKRASWKLAVDLIKFGAPLLLTELSYLLLSYVDRYMIIAYHGLETVGVYSVGYNVAMYISDAVVLAISYSVVPIYVEMYEREGRKETETFLNRVMYYLIIPVITMSGAYFGVAKDLFITLASAKYSAAAAFSPIVLIGNFLLGLSTNMFSAGLYLEKRTLRILANMSIAVVVNIVANIILLPRYGAMGAAIATLVACVGLAALNILSSYKVIAYKVSVKRIGYYLLLGVSGGVIAGQVNVGNGIINLVAKLLTGCAIIVPGILVREGEIVSALRSYVSGRSGEKAEGCV